MHKLTETVTQLRERGGVEGDGELRGGRVTLAEALEQLEVYRCALVTAMTVDGVMIMRVWAPRVAASESVIWMLNWSPKLRSSPHSSSSWTAWKLIARR